MKIAVIGGGMIGSFIAKELCNDFEVTVVDNNESTLNQIEKHNNRVSTINFDLEDALVTNARFSLTRDMHCWALAFHWTPIGGNKSFLFSIRSTSTLFRDAKIDIRKPPAFL